MSPAPLGNGTLPRGPLPIPEGDDSCDPCLPPNYTLRCPRLPVSPPSPSTHAGASIVGLGLTVRPRRRGHKLTIVLLNHGNACYGLSMRSFVIVLHGARVLFGLRPRQSRTDRLRDPINSAIKRAFLHRRTGACSRPGVAKKITLYDHSREKPLRRDSRRDTVS